MKKKTVSKVLSLVLTAALVVTAVPAQYFGPVVANAQETTTVLPDGVTDEWSQDEATVKGSEVCSVENGWLHLKADPANGNNPGTDPAMFVNPNTFDFNADGYFSFTMKSNNSNNDVNNSDRFGVYLGYNTQKNGMFVGYDNGGWFWQKYTNGDGEWYSGGRHAAPSQGAEVKVRIDWTAAHTMNLTINDQVVFTAEDFSGITGTMGNQLAIKCGSWGSQTDVFLKDIHYTGQQEETITVYTVAGTVKDAAGNALAGVLVTLDGKTATTGDDGVYTFADSVEAGTYTLKASKDGYEEATVSVTVSDADITEQDITLAEFIEPEVPAEGRKWFHLEGGANNAGGHAYGNPSVKAPVTVVDNDRTMPLDGSVSLSFKPVSEGTPNFGIFYSYVDDNNWLYIGFDQSSGWYYQYNDNGQGSYPGLSGLPAPVPGEETKISISVSHETLQVSVNDAKATTPNQALYTLLERLNGTGRFGVKTNGQTAVEFADVKLGTENCMEDDWGYLAERSGQIFESKYAKLLNVGGIVKDEANDEPLAGAVVRIGSHSATTDENGHFAIEKIQNGTYNASVALRGYVSYEDEITITEDTDELAFALTAKGAIDLSAFNQITSDGMTVYVAEDFPRVYRYDVNGQPAMYGNEEEVHSFKLNGKEVTPEVTVVEQEADSIVYRLEVAKDELNLTMDVKVSVEGKNLTWEIISIEKAEGCPLIATIDFSELNLATIDQYGEDAEFMGAKVSTTTTVSGDERITFDEGFVSGNKAGYLYAFVSGNGYSAGLFSNSEAEGDLRVVRNNGAETMSLNSAVWYYEEGDKGGQAYKNAGAGYKKSELPVAKICLAADINDDGVANWQDGAIAYREIMHTAYRTEDIKDMVNYRIVMNFASAAPNPYLKTADNIKKVYLATDGLPQAVMLKGYGNEGHDSANSEYADIAEREGGADDFRDLIRIAHKYNTEIGIHVNAQEAYQEAASFSDTMVGAPNYGRGWGWLDQSFAIDKLWDLQTQARYKRFVQLYDRINGTSFYSKKWDPNNKIATAVGESDGNLTASMEEIAEDAKTREDNMDFIYLDVWYQNSWETRRIAEEINSLGWRFSTEFSARGEYDSTWQHWSTDAVYGGASSKGFNSEVIRFIRNDQRDSQVLNHPEFGGTADNPLLGGYRLYGFEGWGGDQNYTNYIYQTFNQNLPTRFLQHYQITNWVDYAEDEKCLTGNREKEITLKNGEDTVVVTRVEEQREDSNIERNITLNGRNVLHCGTDGFAYLLPWTEENGTEKLYHWNLDGGSTTWQLPEGWTDATIYELTDQGRVNGKKVTVADGKVTLAEIKGATPYVVVKTEGVKTLENDFGEMDYVTDPGFNGYANGEKLAAPDWTGALDAFTVKTGTRGDQYVEVVDVAKEVAASTKIHGLTAGKDYVAEIYVDNRSDAKATLEITNGTEILSNYTVKSIAQNYFKCDEQHTAGGNASYMQHILIPFTAKGTEATLTLKREAGEGSTMWDDIRVVQQTIDNYQADGSFRQNFESVVQGFYPFVLGPAQGVEDPVTHLSEAHAPYTNTGWNGRVIDDVIEGKYSLKHHGQNAGIIYQTIPQNFRFEAGKTYEVSFDYQTGANGAYALVIGDGKNYDIPQAMFAGTKGTTQGTLKVTGSESGQTWIGLYCNGSNGGDVMGQRDFILDNLVIAEEKDPVIITVESEKEEFFPGEKVQLTATNAEDGKWVSDNEEVVRVDENGLVTMVGAGTATITVTGKNGKTDSVTLAVIEERITVVQPEENGKVMANTEEPVGEGEGNGVASAAADGNPATIWHSNWSGDGFTVSEDNPAIITLDFGEERELTGFYFIQRASGGVNGLVSRYQWALGNEYDAESFMVTDQELSAVLTADESNGARNENIFDEVKTGRYLQIRVLEGKNGFAALAEIAGIFAQKPATGVTITAADAEGGKATMNVNEEITLTPIITKGDFLVGPFTWTSADEKVATVTAAAAKVKAVGESAVVTAVGKGETTVTFTAANGVTADFIITVNEKNVPEEPDPEKPDPEKPDPGKTGGGSAQGSQTQANGAETGDNSMAGLYVTLVLACAAVFVTVFRKRKTK